MKHSILSGNPDLGEDQEKETPLRPQKLSEFQGQAAIKDNLAVFIEAAKARNEPLDHLFISGPPGLGKTTLASIVAHEMGGDLVMTSAPALDKPKDLAGLLTTLKDHSLFFIDEIHRLRPAIEEMLYIAMEDYELDFVIGQGVGARTVRIPVPPFTLVGATTKPGRVSSPLHTRFGIVLRIDFYPVDELREIIMRSSEILNIPIDNEACALLASCARGTPRVANRLLRRLRDFCQVDGRSIIDKVLTQASFERLKIDPMGLEHQDREILRAIIEKYQGGPVGVETLAMAVGESADSLEDFYEPYLVQGGFLQRTARGRMATIKAYEHLGISMKGIENSLF
ncbi:MAG: Holliday junction branch migration DNA helicase RuvB [Spirochaetia bacterium]